MMSLFVGNMTVRAHFRVLFIILDDLTSRSAAPPRPSDCYAPGLDPLQRRLGRAAGAASPGPGPEGGGGETWCPLHRTARPASPVVFS